MKIFLAQIRDIHGLIEIEDSHNYLLLGTIIFLLIIIVLFVIFIIKKSIKKRSLSSFDKAKLKLENSKDLIGVDKGKDFLILTSEIIRDYISSNFSINFKTVTSVEFIDKYDELLEQNSHLKDVLTKNREKMKQFMKNCDLGIFANQKITQDRLQEIYVFIDSFIKKIHQLTSINKKK